LFLLPAGLSLSLGAFTSDLVVGQSSKDLEEQIFATSVLEEELEEQRDL
jgi:hypothetical protein